MSDGKTSSSSNPQNPNPNLSPSNVKNGAYNYNFAIYRITCYSSIEVLQVFFSHFSYSFYVFSTYSFVHSSKFVPSKTPPVPKGPPPYNNVPPPVKNLPLVKNYPFVPPK